MHRVLILLAALAALSNGAPSSALGAPDTPLLPKRVLRAEVVAFETPIVYNRFGSMNPYGMVYALESDVQPLPGGRWTLEGLSCPGALQHRAGIRPRPLVLRGNVGDDLVVTLRNGLLRTAPDLSRCRKAAPNSPYAHLLAPAARPEGGGPAEPDANWPKTRLVNMMIPGVNVLPGSSPRDTRICRGLEGIAQGEKVTCTFRLTVPGTHLFSSTSAPVGGEGDGGSLTHGLFGALHVEREGSRYFRSQVTRGEFDAAWKLRPAGGREALNYAPLELLTPLGGKKYRLNGADLNAIILEPPPTLDEIGIGDREVQEAAKANPAYRSATPQQRAEIEGNLRKALKTQVWEQAKAEHARAPAFREFTAIFHDELKTFYAEPFKELGTNKQLIGVKDGFALNYGASGMGSLLLANRLGIGPAAKCVECLYEEFFLQSWANGDPALLEGYRDDPSNVFHSYLNDRVAFRNLHAGPKETHVFHLHAHQWLSASDEQRGSYLDSQTIAPMQGFQYQIYHGGLRVGATRQEADHDHSNGSGNRNRTVGDSIFHCHLYPHFAQGMWGLWRVHDTLEDGHRTLPDGQPRAGLSLRPMTGPARPGTNVRTGEVGPGTPIPGLVPLPDQALPPAPTYGDTGLPGYPFYIPGVAGHRAPQPPLDLADDAGLPRHVVLGGERHLGAAPAAAAAASTPHAAHDPHAAHTGVQRSLALADFTAELTRLNLRFLDPLGEPLERRAMQFHAGQFGRQPLPGGGYGVLKNAKTGQAVALTREAPDVTRGHQGYASSQPSGKSATFTVNGAPPQPGAPFADPCGAPSDGRYTKVGTYFADPDLQGFRRYDVSAIQLDLVVNKDGWHDPQGRINVLSGGGGAALGDKARYFANARAKEGRASTKEEPFFFRAQSGECITFYHSNRIPMHLERDDFQMRTPTDIIGQHIHLVKFDVTSSDGSGNGWNYEDGTLAPDAVLERKCAYNAWYDAQRGKAGLRARFADPSVRAFCGPGKSFPEFGTTAFAELPVQTSVQRWFADPIVTVGRHLTPPDGQMNGVMKHKVPASVLGDRTLRTVFTHDHFAPSSIQQHGFYSALLIEPLVRGGDRRLTDAWLRPDGSPLADAQGQAVGWQAILRNAKDGSGHPDQREFALAVADFALLYEPRAFTRAPQTAPDLSGVAGLDRLIADAELYHSDRARWTRLRDQGHVNAVSSQVDLAALRELRDWARRWWALNGRPVDPPARPEAISTAHHNPFLINYKQDPMPLRLGQGTTFRGRESCGNAFVLPHVPGRPYLSTRRIKTSTVSGSVSAVRPGERGDSAGVFRSDLHGDPCTPVLEAYEGERVQFRLVQGAQEVQHVFTVEGLSWMRVPDYEVLGAMPADEQAQGRGQSPFGVRWVRDNPLGYTNAQEVGISEHFEAEIPPLGDVMRNTPFVDRLYHFGTQDALWNGAWGLLRAYNGVGAKDLWGKEACTDPVTPGRPNPTLTGTTCPAIGERLASVSAAVLPRAGAVAARAQAGARAAVDNRKALFPQDVTKLSRASGAPYSAADADLPSTRTLANCPVPQGRTTLLRFTAVATRVDLLRRAGVPVDARYDARGGLYDPDALLIVPLTREELRASTAPADTGFGAVADANSRGAVKYERVMAQLRKRGSVAFQPFVLRATAGQCVELTVYNALKAPREAQLPDHRGDAPMPTIVPLNVGTHPSDPRQLQDRDCNLKSRTGGDCGRDLQPSASLSLTVPQVALAPDNLLSVGWNSARPSAPPSADGTLNAEELLFYTGHLRLSPSGTPGSWNFTQSAVAYDFGPLPLRAYSDVIGQGSHGLFGVVVIEPQGAAVMRPDPRNPAKRVPVSPERWHTLGPSAFVCTGSQHACQTQAVPREGFQEYVLAYQDGLNLWQGNAPVRHCLICDDSYDLGDRGVGYRSSPLWARLKVSPDVDLNTQALPRHFLTPAYAPISTPTVQAVAGQDVRLRVLQVDGRARQHAFVLSGFGYQDQLPHFGSPNSTLVAPGKAFTARLEGTEEPSLAGCSLYRDGPGMFMGGGMWGLLDLRPAASPTQTRC